MQEHDQIPNRCSYRYGVERCAYLARAFPNCTEQRKDATLEHGLCWGHFNNHDLESCRTVLDASLGDIPIDCDYSSAAIVKASRNGYSTSEIPQMSDQEWLANRRACQPIIDRIKAMLAAGAAKHRTDAMPHLLSGVAWPYRSREPGEDDA